MSKSIDPRINLKNRYLALALAIVIPGLGHFYQGRYFKSALFCLCILGTFFLGVSLGEGRTVYIHYYQAEKANNDNPRSWREHRKYNIGYASQALVGIAAWPAYIQSERYDKTDFSENYPGKEIDTKGFFTIIEDKKSLQAPCEGKLTIEIDKVTGIINNVSFQGKIKLPESPEFVGIEILNLVPSSGYKDQTPIFADPAWRFRYFVKDPPKEHPELNLYDLHLTGPDRALADWYQVPPTDDVLRDLNGRLGKFWELAMVITWIAGLLNVLAIWDAYEGPAYGYGDEKPEPADKKEDAEKTPVSSTNNTANNTEATDAKAETPVVVDTVESPMKDK